ncbi:MAG: hypothetical protein HOY78_11375 [Saccharothrix sp.]|nr:hypothetical protein [Saccharothrix sp.]
MIRTAIGATGVALGLYGAYLALDLNPWQVLPWFLGGPAVHDLLVAPTVAVLGLAIRRSLPPRWRVPVTVGAVLTGVLGLLSIPLLWRPHAGPHNPGLLDRPYTTGLVVTYALIWTAAAVAALLTRKSR